MPRLIGEDERKLKIKDYINSHEECSPEEVLKELGGIMSRRTFYRLLGELKNENQVLSKFRNKRDTILYLNGQNPFLIISNNLDKFENSYFDLLDKVIKELEKPHSSVVERANILEEKTLAITFPVHHSRLFECTIFVFHEAVTNWLFDISLKLPQKVKSPEHLEKINGFILTRITGMYLKLFEKISVLTEDHLKEKWNRKWIKDIRERVYQDLSTTFKRVYGADEDPREPSETFKFFDLDKEFHEVFRRDLI